MSMDPKLEEAGLSRRERQRRRRQRRGLRASLRTYFLTGLIVAAPIAITGYLTFWFVVFVDETVARLLPRQLNPSNHLPFTLPGLGVIIALLGLTLIGFLTTNFLGRSVLRLGERMLDQMPVVRSIYSALKQLFEAVFSHSGTSFRKVCIVEYPRKGLWAIGFVTTEQSGPVGRVLDKELIGLFVPTTPNPTSGYLVYVSPGEIQILDMSVEDAMKLVVSGGVVIVPDQRDITAKIPVATAAEGPPAEGEALAADATEDQPDRNSLAAASRSNK